MKERGGMVQGLSSLDFGNHVVPKPFVVDKQRSVFMRSISKKSYALENIEIQDFYCITCIEE